MATKSEPEFENVKELSTAVQRVTAASIQEIDRVITGLSKSRQLVEISQEIRPLDHAMKLNL